MTTAASSRALMNAKHFGLEPFSAHCLRHSADTHLAELGVSYDLRKRLKAHVFRDVSAVYDHHAYLHEKADALERWATRLRAIVAHEQTPAMAAGWEKLWRDELARTEALFKEKGQADSIYRAIWLCGNLGVAMPEWLAAEWHVGFVKYRNFLVRDIGENWKHSHRAGRKVGTADKDRSWQWWVHWNMEELIRERRMSKSAAADALAERIASAPSEAALFGTHKTRWLVLPVKGREPKSLLRAYDAVQAKVEALTAASK